MCHPGLPPLPPGCAFRRRERQAAVAPSPSPSVPRARQAAPPHYYYCVCSPTAHRGSFRCRLHRSSFEWGRRQQFANTPGRATAEAGPAMHARMAAP